jgi:hypothetical protein
MLYVHSLLQGVFLQSSIVDRGVWVAKSPQAKINDAGRNASLTSENNLVSLWILDANLLKDLDHLVSGEEAVVFIHHIRERHAL